MTTPSGPGPGQPDPGLAAIISERRQLINLAYRPDKLQPWTTS